MLLVVAPGPASAVGVRGRVDFVTPRGIFPMSEAFVELCQPGRGCASYRTGYDGMYYLDLAPGPHDVLVNGVVRLQIVIPNQPYFDIPPVRVN